MRLTSRLGIPAGIGALAVPLGLAAAAAPAGAAGAPSAWPQNTPDAGLYAFKAAGCGAATCKPISFLELSTFQSYLGAPLAVAEGKVSMASTDNISGRTLG